VTLGGEVHLTHERLEGGPESASLAGEFGVIRDASHGATVEGGLPRLATVGVTVDVCAQVDDELVAAFQVLIPQLSSSNPPPGRDALEALVSSEASTLFVARLDGSIVGSLTLAMFRIPTGVRAWIEDVVVDESARGHGVGEALNRAALEHARRNGAITVDLTSRPSREAANRLYQRMGFVKRESNLYRYEL
jgi:ribosomal protein S18 acetylase RimI-like enzyme